MLPLPLCLSKLPTSQKIRGAHRIALENASQNGDVQKVKIMGEKNTILDETYGGEKSVLTPLEEYQNSSDLSEAVFRPIECMEIAEQ